MSYNYLAAMKSDILEYIKYNINLDDYRGRRDDLEEKLNDELWIDDSVTGNGSGSCTFNREQAREYVQEDGSDYIRDMCSEFGIEAGEIGQRFIDNDWEWIDVTIRCYLLSWAISDALDELSDDLEELEEVAGNV